MKKVLSLIAVTALMLNVSGSFAGTDVYGADNYLLHSTFESGTDGWTGRGSATVSKSSSAAYDGKGSLAVSGRTAEWNGATISLSSSTFRSGTSYSFSAGVLQTSGNSEDISMTLQYTDASGTTNYSNIATVSAGRNEWKQISNESYIIPAGASDVQLYFETASTMDFYVDEVVVASEGTKVDGSSGTVTPPVVTPSTPVKNIHGDVNKDGVINIADLCFTKSAIIGEADSTTKGKADIDGENGVDRIDFGFMHDFLIGKIKELPKPAVQIPEKSYDFPAVSSIKNSTSLPDPFIFNDGSVVSSVADWARRASEISCMYEYYMYGMWRDGSDEEVTYSISGNKMTVNIKRKSTGKTTSFPAVINLPSKVRHDGGAPVIVGMHTGISESTATSLGYAVITVDAGIFSNPVASDDTNHKGAFYDLYPYGNSWDEQTGALMGWSWGCSKILDALYAGAAKELNINPDSSIVTGVSRWGKAASVCGAFDKRFKMCAPSCSGAGGLAVYRYKSEGKTYDFSSKGASSNYRYGQNEPLGSLQSTAERGWFNNRFLEFRSESQLPVDQYMLASLVADPDRYLFIIGSCVSEDWVNAPSMWLCYKATKIIYDYLGISDNIAINIHKEGHAVIEEDIKYMVQYFDYHVYGIQPSIDLSTLQTSVFDLPKNSDPFFSSFSGHWTYK